MSLIQSIFGLLRFNRKNGKAVVLCVFAATVFWFFNALNKNYTTNITFPLAFDYDAEDYVEVRPLPHQVKLNVTGMGWDLFRRSIGIKVPPLVIPLEHPSDTRKIVGSTLPAVFSNQLERLQINFVLTDTLVIALEPKTSRWVSLALDSPTILFKPGYTKVTDAVITPDSVYIEGPLKLVQSLSEPLYLKISRRNIDKDYHELVDVTFLNQELIQRTPAQVDVHFEVDPLVAVQDSLEIVFQHVPPRLKPPVYRLRWPCTVMIPKRFVDDWSQKPHRAIVDLSSLTTGSRKILPMVEDLPPQAYLASGDSISINR